MAQREQYTSGRNTMYGREAWESGAVRVRLTTRRTNGSLPLAMGMTAGQMRVFSRRLSIPSRLCHHWQR